MTALTYENMTKQLKAIYDSSGSLVDNSVDIKSEPVYYNGKVQDSLKSDTKRWISKF